MFQIDLNSDLKNEPELNNNFCSTVISWITWTSNARILKISESQFGQICLNMCNFVNMTEYAWEITWLNKPDAWICVKDYVPK